MSIDILHNISLSFFANIRGKNVKDFKMLLGLWLAVKTNQPPM